MTHEKKIKALIEAGEKAAAVEGKMSKLTHDDVLRMSRNFKDGQYVSYTRKPDRPGRGHLSGHGHLSHVWLAMDAVAFTIVDDDGSHVTVFPELGDSIAHAPDVSQQGASDEKLP